MLGLPGLAINWGPISGAGVMEREAGVAKLLTMAGLGFINAKEGKLKFHLSITRNYRKNSKNHHILKNSLQRPLSNFNVNC